MANLMQFDSTSIDDLDQVCEYCCSIVLPGTIFLLDGEMSAGKTTLISKIFKKLNIQNISSPTYAIHHVYEFNENKIHHIDLHRLENTEDIDSSGIWDFFQNPNDIFFIEWAKNIDIKNWPLNFKIINIQIDIIDNFKRQIQIIS